MSIQTIFAHISCRHIGDSLPWYEKLFGRKPVRRPTPGSAEWQFSDSAEVQLQEQKEYAGYSTLTLGVLPLAQEQQRLQAAGLKPGPIQETNGYFIMRIRDPDGNLIIFASAEKS